MTPLLREGTSVSRYRVSAFLGAGGMGEVYKAHDPSLDRSIALKILPPKLITSEEGVRRFTAEARAASSLNHPNIITIHEIGDFELTTDSLDARRLRYIAMELIEGESLRRKIDGRLELSKLLDLLVQVADGLAAAHANGIVHRDLKPENIMITRDGFAKVLDFGLAKLVERPTDNDGAGSQLATSPRTHEGVMLGTVGYMSPEQVEGRPVDHRSDIFSFGCILYEAAGGRHPFRGASTIDTLHRIVHDTPTPITEVRPNAPSELQRIIRKCLAKEPDDRYQSIKDVAIDLRDLRREMASGSIAIVPGLERRGKFRTALIAAAIVAVVVPILILQRYVGREAPQRSYHLQQLTTEGNVRSADISPDGKYVAYITLDKGKSSLLLRQLAGGASVPIVGPDENAIHSGARFSSDGTAIYFWKWDRTSNDSTAYRIPTLGGTPTRILDKPAGPLIPSPDGTALAFTRHDSSSSPHEIQLLTIRPDGTGERKLAGRKEPAGLCCPVWMPDRKRLVYGEASATPGTSRYALGEIDLGSGKIEKTAETWTHIADLAILDDKTLLLIGAKSFVEPLQIWEIKYPDGPKRRITTDVHNYFQVSVAADRSRLLTLQSQSMARLWTTDGAQAAELTSGTGAHVQPSAGANGRIAYVAAVGGRPELRVRDADGREQQIGHSGHLNYGPDLTPDGMAIVFASDRDESLNIWKATLDGAPPMRLTNHKFAHSPDCTPDKKWIVYSNSDAGQPSLWRIPSEGGQPVQLSKSWLSTPVVSPDGRQVAATFWDEQPESRGKVALLSIDGGEPTRLIDLPPTASTTVRWSPDGKALCYIDTRRGVSNIWEYPLDGRPARQLTSFTEKQIFSFDWAADGKTLICSRGETIRDLYLLIPETDR